MKRENLSGREARFVTAYLNTGDAEAAALEAGYSPARAKHAQQTLLEKPAVRQAVARALQTRPRAYAVTEQTVLRELSAIAFSDFTDYVQVEDGTVRITDSRSLDYSRRAAIAAVKEAGKGVEIKLHDKQKALELLVKYLGLFRCPEEEENTLRVVFDGPEEWTE